MRRWQVVTHVKRYPTLMKSGSDAYYRVPTLADPFTLGEITTHETRHWTRWGAESKAAWFNVKVGPSIMWHAVAERAT